MRAKNSLLRSFVFIFLCLCTSFTTLAQEAIADTISSPDTIAESPADSLLNFIALNHDRSSIYLLRNNVTMASVNEDKPMPLAHAMYIMIAVEFAKQAGRGIIDEDEYVAIDELSPYAIPGTDDSVQATWLEYERKHDHIKEDSISLVNVARGMTMYNSNANAEFLLDLLGFDNVKNNTLVFGLKRHSAIFPMAASLLMYQGSKKLKNIRNLTEEEYCKSIFTIHESLKDDSLQKRKFKLADFTPKLQKLWSDRLTAGTTKEYVTICKALNNRKLFSDLSYGIIAEVLEYYMEDPEKLNWLKHAGSKDGSTNWVLTKALYGTTRNNTKIEMAYFFNELTPEEHAKLKAWAAAFELKVLSDDNFREKIATTLRVGVSNLTSR